MQSSALQDLAHPLLEFQALTKVLLRRWKDVKVDLEVKEHRIALKGLHLASNPESRSESKDPSAKKRHNPEKWRRLGFETESPAWEFGEVGFLGMMDLTDFVRKDEDGFRKVLLEQNAKAPEYRCPLARASITITSLLYHQFQVDKSEIDDIKTYQVLESRTNYERAFRPLLLQWSRLHTGALLAFLRLWGETSASLEDYEKVTELIRVLIYHVIGQAPRTKEVQEVEEELAMFEYLRLRDLQMEILENTYEGAWGNHLKYVFLARWYSGGLLIRFPYFKTCPRRVKGGSFAVRQRAEDTLPFTRSMVSSVGSSTTGVKRAKNTNGGQEEFHRMEICAPLP
jgi:engulfment and cell motility protein 1